MRKKIEMTLARGGECNGCIYRNSPQCKSMPCIVDNKVCVKYVHAKSK